MIKVTRSRLLGLEDGVETKSRFLNLDRDILVVKTNFLESVEIFSTVETYSLPVSRSRHSIETTSRQIETPRLKFITFDNSQTTISQLMYVKLIFLLCRINRLLESISLCPKVIPLSATHCIETEFRLKS